MKKIISLVLISTLLFSCDRFSKNKQEDKSADQDMSLAKVPSSNSKEILANQINSGTSTTSNNNIL